MIDLGLDELLNMKTLSDAERSVLPDTEHVGLPHLPVVFMVDTSDSMNLPKEKPYIGSVNQVLDAFFRRVRTEDSEFYRKLRRQGDFCIVGYGTEVSVRMPWTGGEKLPARPLGLIARDSTPMGAAVIKASEMLLARYLGYKETGTRALCGFVFNLTDGAPTDMHPVKEENGQKALWERARNSVQLFESMGSSQQPYAQFIHFSLHAGSLPLLRQFAGDADLYLESGEELPVQRVNMLEGTDPFDRFIKYVEVSLRAV